MKDVSPSSGTGTGAAAREFGPYDHVLDSVGGETFASIATMLAPDLYGITVGFAVASLGFGFTRPGFTAGASLAVPLAEQGAVAGVITSANGISFVAAPTIGISLYTLAPDLPFVLCALLLVGLALFGQARLAR